MRPRTKRRATSQIWTNKTINSIKKRPLETKIKLSRSKRRIKTRKKSKI